MEQHGFGRLQREKINTENTESGAQRAQRSVFRSEFGPGFRLSHSKRPSQKMAPTTARGGSHSESFERVSLWGEDQLWLVQRLAQKPGSGRPSNPRFGCGELWQRWGTLKVNTLRENEGCPQSGRLR